MYYASLQGALQMEASRRVVPNRHYEGLSFEAAGHLRSYFHCRAPETPAAAAALTRKGTLKIGWARPRTTCERA